MKEYINNKLRRGENRIVKIIQFNRRWKMGKKDPRLD